MDYKRNDVAPGFKAIEKPRSELSSIASKIMGSVSRPQQPPAKPQPEKMETARKTGMSSSIAPDMTITGNILCEGGAVQVLGNVKGELRISDLVIGVGGQVDGDVYALTLSVQGTVNGTIHANHVKLLGTAVVKGDIYHHSLTVEQEALFEGLSRRMESEMGSVQMQALQPPAAKAVSFGSDSKAQQTGSGSTHTMAASAQPEPSTSAYTPLDHASPRVA